MMPSAESFVHIKRTEMPDGIDEYVFSNGQEPPLYAMVWYDAPTDMAHETVVVGQGPMTDEQLGHWFDATTHQEVIDRMTADSTGPDATLIAYRQPLAKKPPQPGAAAREVARHIFTLAALSGLQSR